MTTSTTQRKSILAAVIGNALEYYDVTLYGYFAVSLAPLFFPSESQFVSIVSSFGAFASSFLMRPLGGMFFGYFGDRIGRKRVLFWTLILMSFPTMGLGLLPSYEKLGFLSPLLLILCRLLQGFCAGGEYSGAAIYINEHSPREKVGFMGSLLALSGFLGALLGTSLSIVFTSSLFPEWGWRIPFVLGGILGILGLIIRKHIVESPSFQNNKNKLQPQLTWAVFKLNKRHLLATFGIGGAAVIPYYILSIYMNKILVNTFHYSTSKVMIVNSVIMLIWIITLPIAGRISDKIGQQKLMLGSSILTSLLAFPAFYYLYANLSISRLMAFQLLFSLISVAFVAPISSFLPKLFQIHHRYFSIATFYSLGAALLGGTTPLIVTLLVNWSETEISPAIYLALSGIIGYVSIQLTKTLQIQKQI